MPNNDYKIPSLNCVKLKRNMPTHINLKIIPRAKSPRKFINTLSQNTGKVLRKLKKADFIKDFYLSGGTALALQIGHRESEDLDFFIQESFAPERIQAELEKAGKIKDVELSKGTLNCFMDSTQLQFLHYPYKMLEDKVDWEGINLSSVVDIACTKLLTVSSRGSKKDFIDIHFLLKKYELPFLFEKLAEKYPDTNYNLPHILKSLVFFKDANGEPSPRMRKEVSWEKVKLEIVEKVKNYKV